MTREQIALASRAVAGKGWRWMPGMLTTDGFRICRVDADGYKFGYLTEYSYAHTVEGDVLPDLTDAASLGCLLALVREALHSPRAHVLYVAGLHRWECADNRVVHGVGATEAEALVAALEEEP